MAAAAGLLLAQTAVSGAQAQAQPTLLAQLLTAAQTVLAGLAQAEAILQVCERLDATNAVQHLALRDTLLIAYAPLRITVGDTLERTAANARVPLDRVEIALAGPLMAATQDATDGLVQAAGTDPEAAAKRCRQLHDRIAQAVTGQRLPTEAAQTAFLQVQQVRIGLLGMPVRAAGTALPAARADATHVRGAELAGRTLGMIRMARTTARVCAEADPAQADRYEAQNRAMALRTDPIAEAARATYEMAAARIVQIDPPPDPSDALAAEARRRMTAAIQTFGPTPCREIDFGRIADRLDQDLGRIQPLLMLYRSTFPPAQTGSGQSSTAR